MNYLINAFEKTFIREERYMMFLDGLKNTLIIALCATLIGVAIGGVALVLLNL
jgi:ABC-type amino acid transport system permease subunit